MTDSKVGVEADYLHWLETPPVPEARLIRKTYVRLARTGRTTLCDSRDLGVVLGETVLVETDHGRELGRVSAPPLLETHRGGSLPPVLRRGEAGDARGARLARQRERDALRLARAAIRKLRLQAKLVGAHAGDRKVTLYVIAEGRIDERGLVRQVSRDLRGKVSVRRVGSRDAASLLGGVGVCGEELCCSRWLPGFDPVSIRHAKSQSLEMYLDKLQGVCGRLMCCLVYEHEMYKEMRVGLPRVGRSIETPRGEGVVREVNIPLRKIRVQIGNEQKTFSADELGLGGSQAEPQAAKPAPSKPETSDPAFKPSGRRRRRSRRRGGRKKSGGDKLPSQ